MTNTTKATPTMLTIPTVVVAITLGLPLMV